MRKTVSKKWWLVFGGAALSAVCIVSIEVRRKREFRLNSLPSADKMKRSPDSLIELCERSRLVGKKSNVLHELEDIRQWHRDHGYRGGVVLRELQLPLYGSSHEREDPSGTPSEIIHDARHCYYLYYEVFGNGQVKQEIFCRGTTLWHDIVTDLKAVYVFDEELGCHLHMGFRDHADFLLADLEPLLATPGNPRATVELCGHSLGGAVGLIVALKLRKRKHNVVRVTTFGSPRICHTSSVHALTAQLPADCLRVENEYDIVPFLPPFGGALGDKLWLFAGEDKQSRYIPVALTSTSQAWVNWGVFNLYMPETLMQAVCDHRIATYIDRLQRLQRVPVGDLKT